MSKLKFQIKANKLLDERIETIVCFFLNTFKIVFNLVENDFSHIATYWNFKKCC